MRSTSSMASREGSTCTEQMVKQLPMVKSCPGFTLARKSCPEFTFRRLPTPRALQPVGPPARPPGSAGCAPAEAAAAAMQGQHAVVACWADPPLLRGRCRRTFAIS